MQGINNTYLLLKLKQKQNGLQLYKGTTDIKKYKSKVPRCTMSLYNKRQNVTIKINVQYMALCNTVLYSYGKYMKVRHYKWWQNMLDNEISQ